MTLASALLFFAAGTRPRSKLDVWLRIGLVQLLSAAALAGWLLPWQAGYLVVPVSLCDLALFAGIVGLCNPDRQGACQLLYFWGLAGGLQALLTPDLAYYFPEPGWLQFHAHHAGLVLCACYLASTKRIRPTWRSAGLVWAITNGYAAVAGLINLAYGTNFGYLSHKPARPSVLDYFGPWPWYLIAMEAIGTVSIVLLTIPLLKRR
ncbi:MAG: TIGR02206 family membrane protein [Methylococcaceae bacterium]|nr:TIGR02206 family membrane protein [Methylococcaceae bacterium]MCI0668368.1 TIGR02206 family membrane protein [Methylococcaceae bacterium]MCI0734270.1 TIGR02206 family membrane protein [Methylococcaceae bacterium]